MRQVPTLAAVTFGTWLFTLDRAWSQGTPPNNRPSPSQVFSGMSSWFSNHRAAGIVIALAVVVGIGMLIFNRMGSSN